MRSRYIPFQDGLMVVLLFHTVAQPAFNLVSWDNLAGEINFRSGWHLKISWVSCCHIKVLQLLYFCRHPFSSDHSIHCYMYTWCKSLLFSSLILIPVLSLAQYHETDSNAAYDTVAVHQPDAYNIVDMVIYYKSTQRPFRAGRLLNGKKQGIWRTYYETGVLNRVEEFSLDFYDGIILIFEDDGTLSREQYIRNGKLEGVMHDYYPGGTMKSEEYYSSGLLNGWRRFYNMDGLLQEEGMWKAGKRDSLSRWCNAEGLPSIEYNYEAGVISGTSRQFYESGNVKSTGQYSNNMEEGAWKEFYETGTLKEEGTYKAGKKSGNWKVYDPTGKLLSTQVWEQGQMVKETAPKK